MLPAAQAARAPARHGAGTAASIALVRSYIAQQQRFRDRPDEVAAMLRKRSTRRRPV